MQKWLVYFIEKNCVKIDGKIEIYLSYIEFLLENGRPHSH